MKAPVSPFGNEFVRLRMLTRDDLPMTLAWRNHDDVRRWFKTSAVLTMAQHASWFERYLESDNSHMFIVEHQGRPVGQVGIYDIDPAARCAEVGRFVAAPGESGRGYLKAAILLLQQWATATLGLQRLYLDVFDTNERAIGLYRACGFVETDTRAGLVTMSWASPC